MASRRRSLAGLEPRPFWAHFEALTRIPTPVAARGAGDRARPRVGSRARLRAAAGRGPQPRHPRAGDARTRVRARPSSLQGHLDMVCERDPSSANDPTEGRIALLRDGDWLTADGTTLGADDGVAIAAMMTLVEDESVPHGPLELLMTVAEEVGLEGANALDGSLLTGSTLINLDSEEDGVLTVGCAGSTDTWVRVDAPRDACPPGCGRRCRSWPDGGLGGHSGVQIALGHANAIKVLGRVLREAYAAAPFRLVSLDGGKSRNAIPRDAVAVCVGSAGAGSGVPGCGGVRDRGRPRCLREDRPGSDGDRRAAASRAPTPGRRRATATLLDVDRARADRAARDEPRLRRARRDEHVARRGRRPRAIASRCTACRARPTTPRCPR